MNAQDYWNLINPSEQLASADTQDKYRQDAGLRELMRQMNEENTSKRGYWSNNPELKKRELAEYDARWKDYKPSSTSARSATEWVPDHKLNTYSNWAGAEGQPAIGYQQYGKDNPKAQGDYLKDYLKDEITPGPWDDPTAYGGTGSEQRRQMEREQWSRDIQEYLANNPRGRVNLPIRGQAELPTPGPYRPLVSDSEPSMPFRPGDMFGGDIYDTVPGRPGAAQLDARAVIALLKRLKLQSGGKTPYQAPWNGPRR